MLADYFPNRTIAALLKSCPWFIRDLDCVLTCFDSNPETVGYVHGPLFLRDSWQLGPFAVIRGNRLLEVAEFFFCGFDEFYVVRPETWHALAPSIWSEKWTSERFHANLGVPQQVKEAFSNSMALRYASDGDGLNVLSKNPEEILQIAFALNNS